ncbi:MAG: beta-lactamase family protein [Thalassotalea sp.]|nr:beta-lactamase family protein [Thalassotalea sp.]
MFYKIIIFALLFSCFSSSADEFSGLDDYVAKAKSITGSLSGTSVVLIKDGAIVHEFHTGMADVENKVPVDTNTVYYFASTTKAIMGLSVLQAEQKGLITKDTTLKQLFPELQFKYIDARNYTVRDLLSHTSGLSNEAMTWTFSYTGNHDRERRLEFVSSLKQSLEVDKGEFDYSNIGYNILAIWFDENYEGGWTKAINELVLSPAGMTRSTADIDNARKQGWPIPKPYSYKYQAGQKQIYMNKDNSTLYSVGIFARAYDWGKLITHLLPINEKASTFSKSVVKDSQALLVSNIDSYYSGYGWGWMHSNVAGEKVLVHTGGFDGASVEVSYSPEKNIGVVIAHNESGLIANELNGSIAEIAYKMLTEQPVSSVVTAHIKEMEENAEYIEIAKGEIETKRSTLSKRPFNSHESKSSLIGVYNHFDAGTITVRPKGNDLYLYWGNLKSRVYQGSHENEYVLELRPGKFFNMTLKNDKSALTLKGWVFNKS